MASSRPMYQQHAPRGGIVVREWSVAQFASKANIAPPAVAPRFQKPQPRSADSTFDHLKDVDTSLDRLTPPTTPARRYRHDPYSRVCSRVEVSPPAPRMLDFPAPGRFSPISPSVAPLVRAFQQQPPAPIAPAPAPSAAPQASPWVMRDGRRVPVSMLSRVL